MTTIIGPYSEEVLPDGYNNLAKMLTYSIIAVASFISYLLGVFFGDDLEKYWRLALLCPAVITVWKLATHSVAFRFESPK